MANGIRINSGAMKIEVNDEGEYILLPLGNDTFIRDFYKTLDDVQERVKDEQSKVRASLDDSDNILEEMDRVIGVGDYLFEQTERLFGDGTCKKVFGDMRPGVSMFMEFFDAIIPFIEEYQKERDARLNKYGAGRTGSV